MPRKGELNRQAVDRAWPFQVSLDAADCTGRNHIRIRDFCRDLSLSPRTRTYVENSRYHTVFCFADRSHAEAFADAFGGLIIDPKDQLKWPGKR